jgi:hypothetical protein
MLRVTNLVFAGKSLCAPIPGYRQRLCQLDKFSSAQMLRPRRKHSPALLYFPKTQKFNLSSCLTERIARYALIKHFGTLDNIKCFRLTNVVGVGTVEMEGRVRMDLFHEAAGSAFPEALIRYNPDIFNACVIRFQSMASPTANVFPTGRIVYTGFRSVAELERIHVLLSNVVAKCLVAAPTVLRKTRVRTI